MENPFTRQLRRRFIALILVFLISDVLPLASVTHGPELPDPGNPGMSKEQQEQLGLKAVAEVYKQMPVLPDSDPITQYVQKLGKRLETVVPQQYSWPYQFHVIQQKEINAFALPGGPIFVNLGTITAADDEAELAGVIAHEMSHIYMQHSAKAAPKQTWAGVLGALGGMLGGGTAGTLARLGIELGAGSLLLKYSRHDEAQADSVGAIMMYKAGYDPEAMAEFFQKLEEQGGSSGPQFLSDHPNPGNRVQAVKKEIADWPSRTFVESSPDFSRVKQTVSKVKVYTAEQIADGAKQGTWARQNAESGATPRDLPATESDSSGSSGGQLSNVSYNQVQPSANFRTIRQNGFALSAPENWQGHTNSQTGVLIAPSAGVSAGAIAYGVLVNTAQSASSASLDELTQNLIQNLQESNPDLQQVGRIRSIRVNDAAARSVDLMGSSPIERDGQPLREHDWLVTLPSPDGGLLYLVFISPERDFAQLRPVFERMLNSLQLQ